MSKKINLYPKQCESYECKKGINEGWTNDFINICDSCFEKEEDWKADAKREWALHEKNTFYEPCTYRTAWNVDELDDVYDEKGNWVDLEDLSKKEIKQKYRFMDGD